MSLSRKRRALLAALPALMVPWLANTAHGAAPAAPSRGAATGPRPRAGATADEVMQGIDLRGRTIVVTGCNSGIGLETMRVLAACGAHVIGTARDAAKGRAACDSVHGQATPVVLELSEPASIVACAQHVGRLAPRIDALVCNAGIVLGTHEQVGGLEKQFAVNHIGHFLLVNRLLAPVLAARGRVVVVGSGNHRDAPEGGIQFDDLSGAGWYRSGYSHSKLANGLFSFELARRLDGTGATSNCVTPGHTRTNILRATGSNYADSARTPAQGAAMPCYAAAHPAMTGINGSYLSDFRAAPQSAAQTDRAMAGRLWRVSERLVQPHLQAWPRALRD